MFVFSGPSSSGLLVFGAIGAAGGGRLFADRKARMFLRPCAHKNVKESKASRVSPGCPAQGLEPVSWTVWTICDGGHQINRGTGESHVEELIFMPGAPSRGHIGSRRSRALQVSCQSVSQQSYKHSAFNDAKRDSNSSLRSQEHLCSL